MIMNNPKLKQLLYILNDGQFHSGENLGQQLGITRSGIWKFIRQLQEIEIEIEAKTNQGYRLIDALEFLQINQIKPHVSSHHHCYLDKTLIMDEVASTHSYMVEKINQHDDTTLICLAERQTAGRGRFGRQWISPFAKNIILSLRWHAARDFSELSGLSMVVGIAIINALKKYGVPEIELKWPNDILWRNQKVGGVLVDLHSESHAKCDAVISFGLNLSLPKKLIESLEYPIADIAHILQKPPERNKLIGLIIDEMLDTLSLFSQHGLSPFINEWHMLDCAYNRPVSILAGHSIIKGINRGINDRGYLLLENEKGELLSFSSGEVSLRVPAQETAQ